MMKRMTMIAAAVLTVCAVALADRPPVQWFPASSSNYTVGRGGNSIQIVVIHVTEGSASGAANWFANPAAQASAHYIVAHSGLIYECVRDSNTAWHCGNWDYNQRSIGIEHEGFTYQNTWTDAQYRASAALTRWICDTYGVPKDRHHIIGHNEVPDPNHPGEYGGADHHTDPGPYFNWAYYMSLVGAGPSPSPNPSPSPSPSPSLTAQQVTTNTLNVRTGPGMGNSIIGTVHNGQIYVANASSGGWHRIFYDNRTGWCSDAFLTRRVNGRGRRITANLLNVRTGPGVGNSIVGHCTAGEVFVADVLTGSNWLRIYYRGHQYWIYAGFTSIVRL